MSSGSQGTIIRQLDRLFGEGTVSGLTEGELLGRFARRGDEAAFEALIARHGPMVLGVCRRILTADPHSAEDAFQAVFLILVRKAGSIRDGDRLGPWLHGVARRVALRARAHAVRRRGVERPGAEEEAVAAPHDGDGLGPGLDSGDRGELRAVLDAEVDRLPEKYRAPVVLCYLEGLTHAEAAHRLGWPVGTVRSRMAWARDKLRHRLTRRGLAVPAGLVAAALGAEPARASAIATAPAVSSALLQSTLRAAMHVAADKTMVIGAAAGAGVVSGPAAELARGVLQTMLLHKFKIAALAALALGATAGGGLAVALQDGSGRAGSSSGGGSGDDASPGARRLQAQLRRAQAQEESLRKREADLRSQIQDLQRQLAELREGAGEGGAAQPAQGRSGEGAAIAPGVSAGAASTGPGTAAAVGGFGGQPATASSGAGGAAVAGGPESGGIGVAGTGGQAVAGGPATGVSGLGPGGVGGASGFGQGSGVGGFGPGGFGPGGGAAVAGGGGLGGGFGAAPGGQFGGGLGGAPGGVGFPGAGGFPGGGGFGDGVGFGGFASDSASTVMTNSIIAVRPRDSDKVFAYSVETGEWKGYSPPKGVKAVPILGQELLALQMEGETVPQVAAFVGGSWIPQDLKEPVQGRATPVVAGSLAAYGLGRHVYAFSAGPGRWDVLTLPEGSEPAVPRVHPWMVIVESGGKLYTFSAQTGRWAEFDTRKGD